MILINGVILLNTLVPLVTKSSSIQCVYITIGSVVITVAVVTIVTVVEIN